MLNSHEIFARMPTAAAVQLFSFLQEREKQLYQATIDSIAKQRKLRPIFIERKPREERYLWLRETLGKKTGAAISAHLLQVWLVGAHTDLLCSFLDALEIPHDENGTVDTLPPSPSKETLQKAIDQLLAKYDAALVAVYLHTFQALNDDGGWAPLDELLAEDARIQLEPAPAA